MSHMYTYTHNAAHKCTHKYTHTHTHIYLYCYILKIYSLESIFYYNCIQLYMCKHIA